MKEKTYNSRTLEVTIVKVKLQETSETEQDFAKGTQNVKMYPSPPKKKKKWLKMPSLTDALLGGVVSTVMAIAVQYFIQ
ncbi:hypothetical protein VB602_21590 [Vibrio parahaemolyticus]|uniref:hypothetical protein n=1 Tax=Vibrio parahaemolyticus TaxID=670 RepID=UPI001869F218|nr:hypothetical protein [Vibrio parahaemolyticus]EGR4675516.1 hypothetical protein [Vibrio parahaemolyticus]EHU4958585.1 hypothetical protein [Vibrio parahaemolyticus]EJG0655409.1 hypothetical protein [Vibrio parahaemolyticus]EJG0772386.1 hypothetical protein [Vibrio parahaemolyticus]EJG0805272.1 hypothetical protein [Vibrio parahaemolyticus]